MNVNFCAICKWFKVPSVGFKKGLRRRKRSFNVYLPNLAIRINEVIDGVSCNYITRYNK